MKNMECARVGRRVKRKKNINEDELAGILFNLEAGEHRQSSVKMALSCF